MREIRTSGLMSGDGKRGDANRVSTRAHPRLYPDSSRDFTARLKPCPDTKPTTEFHFCVAHPLDLAVQTSGG